MSGRVALLSSEPIRPVMAGIGVRYLEMSRALSAAGLDVVLVDPGSEPVDSMAERRQFDPARVGELVADCAVAVAQGQLANDLLLACPELPVAVDLYDPWLVENFHYAESLGLDPYRNDHASWVLQLGRGDFFLCSSEEQRLFYLGLLTALGRVHPRWPADDPERRRLVDVVPFGLPEEIPPHRPLLDDAAAGPRLLFGGLYDWYDPWTVLDALEQLEGRPWTLYLVANPNPDSTPQALLQEVEVRCAERGWWGGHVRLLPWTPAERRWDLLRDADLLVSPSRPGLETDLSMRTRFLEALAVGCPVVLSDGGTVSRLVREHEAGWVVPAEDPVALGAALIAALERGEDRDRRLARGRALAAGFRWSEALAPLVTYCQTPWRDESKNDFAFRPQTTSPDDEMGFRIRRRLRRWLGGEPS